MKKVSNFIVNRRFIILLFFIVGIIYSGIGLTKVTINQDITSYLDETTDTYKALQIMEKEFVSYGTSKIIVKNVSYDEAYSIVIEIKNVDGVKSLPFENTESYFKDNYALLDITFKEDADLSISYDKVLDILNDYEIGIAVSPTDSMSDELAKNMSVVLILAVIVILIVLTLTSNSYIEVLIFPIVFIVSALLNMGTNFWFGSISFITNSIAIILQLALAIDYSIILSHSYAAEKEKCDSSKEAMKKTLAKSIPSILSSSLTTISGMIALTLMHFKIGADLGLVLTKGILFSIITVLLLMPLFLLLFDKLIEKTKHKTFLPKMNFISKLAKKGKYIIPSVFLILIITCGVVQTNNTYAYNRESIDSFNKSDELVALNEIEEIFGYNNQLVVLVPTGSYELEKQIISVVNNEELINYSFGVTSIKITDDLYITDKITYSFLSNMLSIDPETSKSIFRGYAALHPSIDGFFNIDNYQIPIIDLVRFLSSYLSKNPINLDAETTATFQMLSTNIKEIDNQLVGKNYTRIIFNINSSVESAETFELIERLSTNIKSISSDAILAGNSVSSYDLDKSFTSDNLLISILTAVFIFVILVFTFKSIGLATILVLTIQGAIFINFALPVMLGNNVFFFAYLVVSAIQMGATIDYGIVLTSSLTNAKKEHNLDDALNIAVKESLPTILTSGTVIVVAALLIAFIIKDPMVSSIGLFLGIGSIISILSILFVLPASLLLCNKFIEKTTFKSRK